MGEPRPTWLNVTSLGERPAMEGYSEETNQRLVYLKQWHPELSALLRLRSYAGSYHTHTSRRSRRAQSKLNSIAVR